MEKDFNPEIDFSDFICNLFYEEPKKPDSVVLNYDKSNLNELFEKLVRIFKEGVRILYGNTSNNTGELLYNMTPKDFEKISKYFESFGFAIQHKVCHENVVQKLEAFITGDVKCVIKDRDIEKYKLLYPSEISVKHLIKYNMIRSKYLHDKTIKFHSRDLYFFIQFKHTILDRI
tara:strand:+ start:2677 stop:3198 length:522 start_codon:yes stop_codon:yes gene_type:complete